MNNKNTFKDQYIVGLNLLKKDINDFKKNASYAIIVNYVENPLSTMEQKVEEAIKNNSDTEQFYAKQCEELERIYVRFTILVEHFSHNLVTSSTKIFKISKNEILKKLKRKK